MKVKIVGRTHDNDVVYNDPNVSQHHAQLVQHDNGAVTISDMNSKNGTYVNQQRISGEVRLKAGDRVMIANKYPLAWEPYVEMQIPKNKNTWLWIGGGIVTTVFAAAALVFTLKDANTSITSDVLDKTNAVEQKPLVISAQVVNVKDYKSSISKIKEVGAVLGSDNTITLATGNFQNGSFTITLPAINAKHLENFYKSWHFDKEDGITISDRNASIATVLFCPLLKNKDTAGMLEYYEQSHSLVNGGYKTKSYVMGDYYFVDRDVVVKGRTKSGDVYDLTLKAGWNVCYTINYMRQVSMDIPTTHTTNEQKGLKWYISIED
jgi:hypothetical protein